MSQSWILVTWWAGLSTGLGLIVVIGAQNVFVLTQGMSRRHLIVVTMETLALLTLADKVSRRNLDTTHPYRCPRH